MKNDSDNRYLFAAGAALAALAAAPYPLFDLDRFFAPKELALHCAALALALPLLRRAGFIEAGLTDLLLALYLALSCLSALFAPDLLLAFRALAITFSGAALFWAARAAARRGAGNFIAASVAAGAALAVLTSLAQAYGVSGDLFSLNRIPGGTLGNRNFTAHIAAVCAPALLLAALGARSRRTARAWAAAMAPLAAALVLTRSRTALLGAAAALAAAAYGFRRSRALLADAENSARLKLLLVAAAAGVLAALLLPNRLEWRSRSPYLDTVAGIADYRSGSGHGRLEQYSRSLKIAAAHPLLGAGTGNWGAVYPQFVDGFDRSMDYVSGRTANPWPSSDWVAVLSERGLPALIALLLLFANLFLGAWRRAAGPGDTALAAVLAAAAVVGCFDAFLLLPAPALLFWPLAGALAAPERPLKTLRLSVAAAGRLTAAALLFWGAAILKSAGQVAAMAVFSGGRTRARVTAARWLDPSNPRIAARYRAMRAPRVGQESAAPVHGLHMEQPEDAPPGGPDSPSE